jgi:hypothetical protein
MRAISHILAAGTFKAGKSAASGPSVGELALATAAQAFAHQREDVQSAALKLIGKHGLPADGTLRAGQRAGRGPVAGTAA